MMRFRALTRRTAPSAALLAALLWCAPCLTRAQEGGDLQAQILYAWQAEDLARLQSLRQNLQQAVHGEHATVAGRYHLAHADYRLALLRVSLHRPAAQEPLQECIEQLAAVLESDPASAESLILQAACYVESAPLRKLQAVFMRSRAAERLARAQQLSPHNPRAELVRALQRLQATRDSDPVPLELMKAAELFDQAPATSEDVPGWGHAESYLLLGHALRVRGDALGARNWIEKSLIAAPDYQAAQAELALLRP